MLEHATRINKAIASIHCSQRPKLSERIVLEAGIEDTAEDRRQTQAPGADMGLHHASLAWRLGCNRPPWVSSRARGDHARLWSTRLEGKHRDGLLPRHCGHAPAAHAHPTVPRPGAVTLPGSVPPASWCRPFLVGSGPGPLSHRTSLEIMNPPSIKFFEVTQS